MFSINNWSKIIHKYLYPPVCLLCKSPGENESDLCFRCKTLLPYNLNACKTCGAHLPTPSQVGICGNCLAKKPYYDSTIALFMYQEPVRYLIRSLKFHSNYSSARILGNLMADRLSSLNPLPNLIIPIPIHRNRYIERGFNQSLEIARPIARRLGIPLLAEQCVRQRSTMPQSGLKSKDRQKNLKGAFKISSQLKQKHVVIFDDVITTGCTVNEMAKVLRKNNVERIDVWAIARANLANTP